MREIVLDTETTGLDPNQGHRVVEIGALELVNHLPTGRTFHRYLNPARDMPSEAEARFLRQAEADGATVAVLDIPLLFETGGESRVDATAVVSAPEHVQRARALERGLSLERLEALLARQMPDAEKRRRADFVVDSGHGVEDARGQVRQILEAVAKMPLRRK